jgi:hypothetical protein
VQFLVVRLDQFLQRDHILAYRQIYAFCDLQ